MDITTFVISHRDDALLLGDYNSYRAQLSRRLLTLRKKLGRTTPKGKKYTTKAPITVDDISGNHEFVHLLLLISERAWAHAMHMKSTHSADTAPKGITGSTRRHIISRLHKAATYANELVRLFGDGEAAGATEIDILEARAYSACLSGAMEFEKQSWENSLRSYSEARVIYSTLTTSTKKDIFRDILSTAIDPSIRYSAYQRQLPRTVAIPTIARRHFPRSNSELVAKIEKLDPDALNDEPSREKKGSSAAPDNVPKTITWRSRTVTLEDASIALALAAVSTASENLSTFLSSPANSGLMPKEKAAAYDDVLTSCQDAVDATKRAIDELVAEGVGQGDKRMQGLQVTRTAVNYTLVGWRIGRNRVLSGERDGTALGIRFIKKPKKSGKGGEPYVEKEEGRGRKLAGLRERVALYDATLQSLDSVKELPGVVADGPFLKELQGKRHYFQALKCLAIARSHDLLGNRKNALVLFNRASNLAGQPQPVAPPTSPPPQSSPPGMDIQPTEIKLLRQLLQAEVFRFRALVEIDNMDESSKQLKSHGSINKTPLIERINEFPADGVSMDNLVTYPPILEPVPVKPLFLDVAWNYIEYPGRATRSVENPEIANAKSGGGDDGGKAGGKKGWFGFGL
ncbi:hypothetical protein FGG08_005312 [Glutinoglossum americanum]|uniref:Signal recognition particle subunit SRP68 n=1 Tax=Glutinoglossum americanum TaxID=1670608 RepID=A0A9P8KW50_9PEZI|nr:hypothetical protein FGG08_005312 [Glutinoglossum americanum]